MKKFLVTLCAVVLVIGMLSGLAAAEGEIPEAIEEEVVEETEETDPGLLPDSPFYFLKRFVEQVRIIFTFNEETKTDLLAELLDRRALELEALELKYDGQELTAKQQKVLDKAAKALEKTSQNLFDRLLGEEENLEDVELTENEIHKLEKALAKMDKIMERTVKAEGQDSEECQQLQERIQARITKLEQIRDKNPEAAEKGLTRAIENAYKQQARWEEKTEGEPEPGEGNEDNANNDNDHNTDNNGNGKKDEKKPEQGSDNQGSGEGNSKGN